MSDYSSPQSVSISGILYCAAKQRDTSDSLRAEQADLKGQCREVERRNFATGDCCEVGHHLERTWCSPQSIFWSFGVDIGSVAFDGGVTINHTLPGFRLIAAKLHLANRQQHVPCWKGMGCGKRCSTTIDLTLPDDTQTMSHLSRPLPQPRYPGGEGSGVSHLHVAARA